LKYFLFGGMSAAFTLFGISLIYGLSGSVQLGAVAQSIRAHPLEPVFYVGLVMTLAGFAFKLAAVPLHFWAPDVYQGAPAPIAAFVASASKVGSFFVLARVLLVGFGSARGSASLGAYVPGWMPVLAAVAVASMVAGNAAALVQRSLRRLLAYSAIAHAGYALLALFGNQRALPSLLYYVVTYAFTVLGAFAVVAVVEKSGQGANVADLAGLGRRAPLLSFCMMVFMLSLAGIPPLAGFFAKFYVFLSAAGGAPHLGLLWLVVVGVGATAVSLYYYLQVVKQIYAAEPPAISPAAQVPVAARCVILVLAGIVIGLGCAPDILLGKLNQAMALFPF
jgi:NADH-quinone oxidoreductase subunit N